MLRSYVGLAALAAGVVSGLVGTTSTASAAIIASDSFDTYTTGQRLANNANNGGTGFTGNWGGQTFAGAPAMNVVNGGLSYNAGSIGVSGGSKSVAVTGAANHDAALTRQFATGQTGTLYFSFLFKANTQVAGAKSFFQFALNDDTNIVNSGSITYDSGTTNRFGARVGGASGGSSIENFTTQLTDGNTFFLVGKLSKSTGTLYNRLDLFLNPTSLIEPAASATQSASAGISTINYFTLRTVDLQATNSFQFDRLTIGDSYLSVVVPEPATLGLATTAAMLLLARRRRAV